MALDLAGDREHLVVNVAALTAVRSCGQKEDKDVANYYERLEKDTAAARQRFMNIPVIKDMLSEQSMPLQPDPEAKKFMLRIYQRFLEESYYHVRVARIYAVAGFRVVMLIAAGLAASSALSAWLLIEDKRSPA